MQDLNSEHQNPDEFWLCELCMKVPHRLFLVHATAVLGNPDFKNLSIWKAFFK